MTPCAECRESVDRHLKLTYLDNKILRESSDRRGQVIKAALAAMDNGEYGSARRILKTGNDNPPMTQTGVLAKDGAA